MKRLDARALYQAIDEKREARGLSWREVAAEIGVGVSTITRTKGGGRMEVDGMLAMVAWLGTSVENFVHESSNQSPNIS